MAQRERDDDWAGQVPDWWDAEHPYRRYGWEAGQSSIPEFRDPSVHLTEGEKHEVRRWRQYNQEMERHSDLYDEPWEQQEDRGRQEMPGRRSGRGYERMKEDLGSQEYRDYGWEAGQSSLPEFRDPSVYLTDEEWQEVRAWREQNRRMAERSRREFDAGRRPGMERGLERGGEGRMSRYAGRPGPGTRGYFGEPYGEEYAPQGYYRWGFGRGFGSQGYFSTGGNWAIPGPHMGSGPRNYQRLKEQIREDVCERLTEHGQIDASGIEVRVEGDEVILSGSVSNRQMKRMAEDVAESVRGVRDVQNQMRIQKHEESSMPGGGAGRIDRVGKSGVYPASGPMPEGDAEVETMASWGQGERGAEGYQDHGESELRIGSAGQENVQGREPAKRKRTK